MKNCKLKNKETDHCMAMQCKCSTADREKCTVAQEAYYFGVHHTRKLAPNAFIAKRPLRKENRFLCPTCMEKIVIQNFCHNCGQRFDWGGLL